MRPPRRYHLGVERLTRADKASAIACVLANQFNSELTVMLSSASQALGTLEPGHPARAAVHEMDSSARRCAERCEDLLTFLRRKGVHPVRASLAAVLDL